MYEFLCIHFNNKLLVYWQFLMPSNSLKNWPGGLFLLVSIIWHYADFWGFNIKGGSNCTQPSFLNASKMFCSFSIINCYVILRLFCKYLEGEELTLYNLIP